MSDDQNLDEINYSFIDLEAAEAFLQAFVAKQEEQKRLREDRYQTYRLFAALLASIILILALILIFFI